MRVWLDVYREAVQSVGGCGLTISLPPEDCQLYTWGRAGPHLGYEVEESGNKQLRPRQLMTSRTYHVTQVACGCAHTLGEGVGLVHTHWVRGWGSYLILGEGVGVVLSYIMHD